ncbi:Bax inhibitor-1/YccA family protein [Vagococcus sp. BWB3-3]|uniref:Bax inhibitor-1/YccA family protein n=1 Tax=Vagococcus allomyrinae TaxID=2794353 RepID=A0A940PBH9_9ENTE|nr:Bax inhibitor-1/YccA family protein [Vagococcus allomyrinae]MBP1044555.1 Bax inhibitor-1/YccA family protein [Vagococcus allomyrinae]
MEQNQYNQVSQRTDAGLAAFFSKIYAYLGIGIAITAVTSYLVMDVFYAQVASVIQSLPLGLTLIWLLEIALVIFLSAKAVKNPTLAVGGFIAYSIINGITLSFTLVWYTSEVITSAFVAAAVTFGVMAIFGSRTQKNLSAMGQAMRTALIGVIIVMLINVFFVKSTGLLLFISIVTVFVFAGLTAYDHQRIKAIYNQFGDAPELSGMAVFCALQLYLNFINLLLAFLRIFGRD